MCEDDNLSYQCSFNLAITPKPSEYHITNLWSIISHTAESVIMSVTSVSLWTLQKLDSI